MAIRYRGDTPVQQPVQLRQRPSFGDELVPLADQLRKRKFMGIQEEYQRMNMEKMKREQEQQMQLAQLFQPQQPGPQIDPSMALAGQIGMPMPDIPQQPAQQPGMTPEMIQKIAAINPSVGIQMLQQLEQRKQIEAEKKQAELRTLLQHADKPAIRDFLLQQGLITQEQADSYAAAAKEKPTGSQSSVMTMLNTVSQAHFGGRDFAELSPEEKQQALQLNAQQWHSKSTTVDLAEGGKGVLYTSKGSVAPQTVPVPGTMGTRETQEFQKEQADVKRGEAQQTARLATLKQAGDDLYKDVVSPPELNSVSPNISATVGIREALRLSKKGENIGANFVTAYYQWVHSLDNSVVRPSQQKIMDQYRSVVDSLGAKMRTMVAGGQQIPEQTIKDVGQQIIQNSALLVSSYMERMATVAQGFEANYLSGRIDPNDESGRIMWEGYKKLMLQRPMIEDLRKMVIEMEDSKEFGDTPHQQNWREIYETSRATIERIGKKADDAKRPGTTQTLYSEGEKQGQEVDDYGNLVDIPAGVPFKAVTASGTRDVTGYQFPLITEGW